MFESQLVQESLVPLPPTSAFLTTFWNSTLSLFIRHQRVATSFRVRPHTWIEIFRCFGRCNIYYFQGEPEVIVGALTPESEWSVGRWPVRLSTFHTLPAITSIPYEFPDNRQIQSPWRRQLLRLPARRSIWSPTRSNPKSTVLCNV
jgi:hypothetical protein